MRVNICASVKLAENVYLEWPGNLHDKSITFGVVESAEESHGGKNKACREKLARGRLGFCSFCNFVAWTLLSSRQGEKKKKKKARKMECFLHDLTSGC